jgi:hypothetical protein
VNYDLAKQLKDAGFLQRYGVYGTWVFSNGSVKQGDPENDSGVEMAYEPTLSELIEAWGGGFGVL